jgi:hypothetical protein
MTDAQSEFLREREDRMHESRPREMAELLPPAEAARFRARHAQRRAEAQEPDTTKHDTTQHDGAFRARLRDEAGRKAREASGGGVPDGRVDPCRGG